MGFGTKQENVEVKIYSDLLYHIYSNLASSAARETGLEQVLHFAASALIDNVIININDSVLISMLLNKMSVEMNPSQLRSDQ